MTHGSLNFARICFRKGYKNTVPLSGLILLEIILRLISTDFLSVIANSSKRKIAQENKHWPCLWRVRSLIWWVRFACQIRQCFDGADLKSILRLATLRFDYALTKFALYAVFSITFPRVAYIMIGYERRCKLLSFFHLLIFKRKKKD